MQQVLKLNAGDQVSLRLKAGSVFDKQTPQTHFTGIQLPKGLAYFKALKNQSFDVANANVAVSYCYISKILQLMGCNKCSSWTLETKLALFLGVEISTIMQLLIVTFREFNFNKKETKI